MRTLQRNESHRLLLLCCSIGYFSPTWHVDLRGWITTATRQMQLAAVPKLLPPPEFSRGSPLMAAREAQMQLLAARMGEARRSNYHIMMCCWCWCCSEIFIVRTIQMGSLGMCGCTARPLWG